MIRWMGIITLHQRVLVIIIMYIDHHNHYKNIFRSGCEFKPTLKKICLPYPWWFCNIEVIHQMMSLFTIPITEPIFSKAIVNDNIEVDVLCMTALTNSPTKVNVQYYHDHYYTCNVGLALHISIIIKTFPKWFIKKLQLQLFRLIPDTKDG